MRHFESAPGGWRRVIYWANYIEIVTVVLFIVTLLLGEQSRETLFFLYLPRFPLLIAGAAGALFAPFAAKRPGLLLTTQIVLCLVVLFPVMGLALATSRPMDQPIRMVTYNVFFGKAGRAALLEEIAAMPADIVLIQAAFGSLGQELQKRLPERTVRQDGEFVIVSKFALRAADVPSPLPDGTHAMFVKYIVDTPRGALRIYSVHPYSPRHALFRDYEAGDDIAHRDAQIGAAVDAARSDVPPFVIAGDTNLPTLSAIGRHRFSGLTDAFVDVGFGFGYTFPAKRPWMRIDRALGSDGVRFGNVRVGKRGASDHLPLFVDLDLTSGVGTAQ